MDKLIINMKNKKNNIDDYLKLSVIGGIIIVAVSIAYYFVIFIPHKESQKIYLQNSINYYGNIYILLISLIFQKLR